MTSKSFIHRLLEHLLEEALDFASSYISIPENDRNIIKHARKSLLFNKQQSWIKKESRLFDVTMVAYDGVEVCELVSSFLLYALSLKYNKTNIGLYRDDRLSVFRNVSYPHCEEIKKEFQQLIMQHGLKLIIKCNLKILDFLDVTLNLTDCTYKPYHKPNDEICYIHKESTHQPSITKQLTVSIETRLSKISSSGKVFNESVSIYQEALDKSGYNHKLKFQKTSTHGNNTQCRQRKRNITWFFNPPFSKSVVTKIGKTFRKLIDKYFPPQHKLHKLFNRNSVKISYRCMPNGKSIINKHKTVLDPPTSGGTCDCINKEKHPLQEKCLTSNIMYKATLASNQDNYQQKIYGITENKFKQRYANHIKSFRYENHQSDTELPNELWSIRNKQLDPKYGTGNTSKTPNV